MQLERSYDGFEDIMRVRKVASGIEMIVVPQI
jgi:hypothetical protein